MVKIGIRAEDKNKWERRAPIVPEDVRRLIKECKIDIVVQSSAIRAFSDEDYRAAGCRVERTLTDCDLIIAIKEIPVDFFENGKTYMFFSHTTKGQKHNMGMLRRMVDKGCQLIDYEKITDKDGRRLIFFGRFAGVAGMVDSLWALGKRLSWEGVGNPFEDLKQTYLYKSLDEVKEAVTAVALKIREDGFDETICPVVVGFAGYGNVSKGAQEIFDILPYEQVEPGELFEIGKMGSEFKNRLIKVVFKEEHMVSRIGRGGEFLLHDYYSCPENYTGVFSRYLPYLTMLINCIYWDERYPKLVTRKDIKEVFSGGSSSAKLKVIGDISCDIEGAIEVTSKATTPEAPVFVYDVAEEKIIDGWKGNGPVVLAVDNLPCELPVESSTHFSRVLSRFLPPIAGVDFSAEFERVELPEEVKRGVILWHGEFTEAFKYMKNFLIISR